MIDFHALVATPDPAVLAEEIADAEARLAFAEDALRRAESAGNGALVGVLAERLAMSLSERRALVALERRLGRQAEACS